MKAYLRSRDGEPHRQRESYVSEPAPVTLRKHRDFWNVGDVDLDWGSPDRDRDVHFVLQNVNPGRERVYEGNGRWIPKVDPEAFYIQCNASEAGAARAREQMEVEERLRLTREELARREAAWNCRLRREAEEKAAADRWARDPSNPANQRSPITGYNDIMRATLDRLRPRIEEEITRGGTFAEQMRRQSQSATAQRLQREQQAYWQQQQQQQQQRRYDNDDWNPRPGPPRQQRWTPWENIISDHSNVETTTEIGVNSPPVQPPIQVAPPPAEPAIPEPVEPKKRKMVKG